MINTKRPLQKKPCRICHKWFIPDHRVGTRQKTCCYECQNIWHKKQCNQWNGKNKKYFQALYLQKKLEPIDNEQKQTPINSNDNSRPKVYCSAKKSILNIGSPWNEFQEQIDVHVIVFVLYYGKLLQRKFKEEIRVQLARRKE